MIHDVLMDLVDKVGQIDARTFAAVVSERQRAIKECAAVLRRVVKSPFTLGIYIGGGHGDPATSWEDIVEAIARHLDELAKESGR